MKRKRVFYSKIFAYSLVTFFVVWALVSFIARFPFEDNKNVTVLSQSAHTETPMTESTHQGTEEGVAETPRVETISMPPDAQASSTETVSPPSVSDVPTITPETIKPSQPIVEKPATPTTPSSPFNTSEMLDAHNEVRALVDVAPLTWSSSLARSAQGWASTLKKRGCIMEHDAHTKYGENIYVYWTGGASGTSYLKTPSFVVGRFASEKTFYNYSKNTCRRGEDCGHYTQIVWADTTEVGCGVSMCFDGYIQTEVWVCRYNPAGNNGLRPY